MKLSEGFLGWSGPVAGLLVLHGLLPALDCERGSVSVAGGTAVASEDDCNGNWNPDGCDVAPVNVGLFATRTIHTPESVGRMAARDFDSDGDLDVAVRLGIPNSRPGGSYTAISILWNDGEGAFFPSLPVGPRSLVPHDFDAGDIDADGDFDLVIFDGALDGTTNLVILTNDGLGRFDVVATLPGIDFYRLGSLLDIDGDADEDLVLRSPVGLAFLANNGDGTFERMSDLDENTPALPAASADFDGDGDIDLIVTFTGSMLTVPYRNDGAFRFTALAPLEELRPLAATGDFDGDGDVDVALAKGTATRIYENDGEGKLSAHAVLPERSWPYWLYWLASGDLDADGNTDLVTGVNGQGLVLHFQRDGKLAPGRGGEYHLLWRSEAPYLVADIDGDGTNELLLAQESIEVFESRPASLSLDCDADGIPDECGRAVPAIDCADCDADGVADAREIESGTQADVNRNGIPDACEAGPEFALSFHGPGTVAGSAGSIARFHESVRLQTLGIAAGEPGAIGWYFYVTAIGGRIVAATTDGTAAAKAPEGFRLESGSDQTMIESERCGPVAYTSVRLSRDPLETSTLDPAAGPLEVLRLTIEAEIPLEGAASCELRLRNCTSASPYVEYEDTFPSPRETLKQVHLIPASFLRGDVNADGSVNISDAIRTFMYLFLGATEPDCRDTADTNDDGSTDMSDGIHILNDFFREGTGIPDPGPFACGPDPTADEVSCDDYLPCR